MIMPTPRPASSGDTSDGSNNRACPSPVARRSTPPSSSSPPGSSAGKATFTESRLGWVLRSASCHRARFNSTCAPDQGDGFGRFTYQYQELTPLPDPFTERLRLGDLFNISYKKESSSEREIRIQVRLGEAPWRRFRWQTKGRLSQGDH